jgi:alpha-tubulin suppressor-like RCC1 family protein
MKTMTSYVEKIIFRAGFAALLAGITLHSQMGHAESVRVTYQGRVRSGGIDFNGLGQFKFALVTSTNTSRPATATAIMGGLAPNQFVSSCVVSDGGSGYTGSAAVIFSGGGGAGATAIANVSGGVVISITVLNPGSGYSSAPVATIAPPPDNFLFQTYWSNNGTSINGSEPTTAIISSVSNGLFTVILGDTTLANMLAIDSAIFVQPNLELRIWFNDGINGFAPLSRTQPLTYTPYAVTAINAKSLLGTLPASQLTGTIPTAQLGGLYSGAVNFSNANNSFTGSLNGNGAGVTNISANALTLYSTNLSIFGWGLSNFPVHDSPTDLYDVVAISVGQLHGLALRANGTVVAWGSGFTNEPNSSIDLGQAMVPVGLSNVVAVSAGYLHSLALRANGTLAAWGAGQTNDPASSHHHGQSIIPAGLTNAIAVSAGFYHSLALRSNSTVVAWGAGGSEPWATNYFDNGQSVVPAGLSNVIAVSAGAVHNLALRNNGTIVAWGAGGTSTNGLGYGQSTVPEGLSNVIAIAAGGVHSLALKLDGTVVAWGAGTSNVPSSGAHFGQAMVPPGLSNVVAITAGYIHSVALKNDGTVVVWGDTTYEQAVVPPGLKNVVALAPGSLAIHVAVLRKRSSAPVAWLDSDNTFNGNMTVNGNVSISGQLRLDDRNLWLRGSGDTKNGLGWYGEDKTFGGIQSPAPDGPVLFGAGGGALGTIGTNGQKVALYWDASQRVGIGTTSPGAQLSLGGQSAASKLALFDSSGSIAGLGFTNGQFRLHLPNSFYSFAFLDDPTGNELVRIQGSGAVGIGTTTPGARLDVRGDIKLGPSGQYYAPGSGENLRIVRGVLNASGGVIIGSGFTVSHPSTGIYAITFSPAFFSASTVTATADSQGGVSRVAMTDGATASLATIRVTVSTTGAVTDAPVHFIAVGAR